MNILTSNLRRTDLNRVYYYGECSKTLAYAEEKMSVDGVLEYLKRLKVEKNNYISDIDSIVNPKKEEEEKRYLSLEKWTKIRQISAWTCIVGLIFFIIGMIFDLTNNAVIEGIAALCGIILTPVSFLMFVVTKIGEVVCSMIYERFVQDIMRRIQIRENEFIVLCQKYYKEIDDLYLDTLSSAERESLIIQREMNERDKLKYQEAVRTRIAQEEMLETQKQRLAVAQATEERQRELLNKNRL